MNRNRSYNKQEPRSPTSFLGKSYKKKSKQKFEFVIKHILTDQIGIFYV